MTDALCILLHAALTSSASTSPHDAKLTGQLNLNPLLSAMHEAKPPPIPALFACTEPMLEAWPVALEARGGSPGRALSLTSKENLNLTLTPAAFRSIGDAKAFAEALMQRHALGPTRDRPSAAARLVARSVARWQAATRGRMATLYRWPRKHADICCGSYAYKNGRIYDSHCIGYVQ